MLDTTSARNKLRAALAAKDGAIAKFRSALAAERSAQLLLEQHETTLQLTQSVDEDIASYRAGAIREAAQAGSNPSLEAPAHLVEKKRRRDEASANVEAATAAHKTLAAELEDTKQEFRFAEAAVGRAAAVIMVEEAELLAARLVIARQSVWTYEARLSALASMWIPGATRPEKVGLPAHVVTMMQNTQPPALALNASRPTDIEAARWHAYLEALIDDPECPSPNLADADAG